MRFRTFLILAVTGLIGSGVTTNEANAQRSSSLSARDALELVSRQFGSEQVTHLVELRGVRGVPEPAEWQIWVWDERTRMMVRKFRAGRGRATNEGSSEEYYPARSPFGFVRNDDLKLDSKAAFVIAEAEARKAKMGFDSLNYSLRCREFSREPIWTLELIDTAGQIVGKVYISGSTGEVLRTVWIYRGTRGRAGGLPRIVDSSEPRGGRMDLTGSGNASSTPFDNPAASTSESSTTPFSPAPTPTPNSPLDPSPTPSPGPDPATGSGGSSGSGTIDTLIPPPPVPPAP